MKRILTAVAAAALGLVLLTACGDDDDAGASGDYCSDLESAQKELRTFNGGDASNLDAFLETVEQLRDEAPDEVKKDWETLYDAFATLVQAFEDAGLGPDDIEAIQNGQIPDGVDQEALAEATAAYTELVSDPDVAQASDNITAHAEDECDLTLG